MNKLSIKDIANLSGVSVATVSRIINQNGRFSKETEEKVLKIIEETGYIVNDTAKSLRMKKSFLIGIIVPDINNQFFSNLVEKIEILLFNEGYSTIICNSSKNIDKEKSYINTLSSKMVDGIIIISGNNKFNIDEYSDTLRIPYIFIDRKPLNKSNTIFISSDHEQGAIDAVTLLIRHGADKLLFVYNNENSISTELRKSGFLKVLKKNNLFISKDSNLLEVNASSKNFETILMNHIYKNKINGIFAANDSLAVNINNSMQKTDYSIPKDVLLIGFDNTSFTDYTTPTISSVSQNINDLASIATKNLLQRLRGNDLEHKEILVKTEVIEKESTNHFFYNNLSYK